MAAGTGWAGPGFTRPGPEPYRSAERRAGWATDREDTAPAVDWAGLAEPIAGTRARRPAETRPEPEPDWAGRGFSRRGPKPELEAEAG
jgi:hypothetical protein